MYFSSVNTAILKKEIQDFIKRYQGETATLAFKGSPFPDVPVAELIQQIEGFKKVQKKLPSWHHCDGIFYPKKLNLEQTSSEITAQYKSSLVKGNSLVDITGGFGVDAFHFASQFKTVYHIEQDVELSAIAKHNFEQLGATNIITESCNSLEFLEDKEFDIIYADPARRHASKGKVFFLSDCEPNMVSHLDFLLKRCRSLIVKTSPMLDITAAHNELRHVKEIHIIAIDNEVKELLWFIENGYEEGVKIVTQNFTKDTSQQFGFRLHEHFSIEYGLPKKFLYEPNAALMKSGNFGALAHAYGLEKLHQHSHLFTSDEHKNFPGRVFEVLEVIPYQKKNMVIFKNTKANITTRNFPESVATIRKKWRVKDGGDRYLFFTTTKNDSLVMLHCKKVNPSI